MQRSHSPPSCHTNSQTNDQDRNVARGGAHRGEALAERDVGGLKVLGPEEERGAGLGVHGSRVGGEVAVEEELDAVEASEVCARLPCRCPLGVFSPKEKTL